MPGVPTDITPSPVTGQAGIPLTAYPVAFNGGISSQVNYKAAIDWGDGTSTFATVGSTFGIGSRSWARRPRSTSSSRGRTPTAWAGKYTLKIAILAPDGSKTWTSTTATIAPKGAPTT